MNRILVTGGTGFIGSHTVVQLVEAGFECIIVDDLSNSSVAALKGINEITGKPDKVHFEKVSLGDKDELRRVFVEYSPFKACIHFAGQKAVGESVVKPLDYYANNVGGAITLCRLLEEFGCKQLIFSSSCTVYGGICTGDGKLTEESPVGIGLTNPYGETKFVIEMMLRDLVKKDEVLKVPKKDSWTILMLRYFNPVGAHPTGEIGESPQGLPTNLAPFIMQVALGLRDSLSVFADPPYDTPDGTGIRDYIHVLDVADGHVSALDWLEKHGGEIDAINLGRGEGLSVLDVVAAAERAVGHPIKYEIKPRRPGDASRVYSSNEKAQRELNFECKRTVDDMFTDLWKFWTMHPQGLVDTEE